MSKDLEVRIRRWQLGAQGEIVAVALEDVLLLLAKLGEHPNLSQDQQCLLEVLIRALRTGDIEEAED